MTIDESEIRRLAHGTHLTRCAVLLDCMDHDSDCDAISHAIRTALAAEREQHARDVADARAKALQEALNVALAQEARVLSRRTRDGQVSYYTGRADASGAIANVLAYRRDAAEARAQALNDSPRAVADRKDGRKPDHPQVQGSANRRLDSADGVSCDAPPSGINQGSGAGEACGNWDGGWPPCAMPMGHGGGVHRDVNGGVWPANGFLSAPPPSPASPTGETRDEADVKHDCTCNHWSGRSCSCTVASAPGGAPGVETCRCSHERKEHDARGVCWDGDQDAAGHCNCAKFTPSTETPTGGRSAPTTGGRGRAE